MNIETLELNTAAVAAFRTVETKGHSRYIRYLLSKKMPIKTIYKELNKMALSCPTPEHLKIYFVNIIYPLAKEYGVHNYYTTYMRRMSAADEEAEALNTLNFEIAFKDKDADRIAFCKFVKALEIDEMWSREIVKYYGTHAETPRDEDGNYIINSVSMRCIETVLTCPRKYVIDKLLLEEVPTRRIVKYMLEKYQIRLNDMDIFHYSTYFFNFKRRELEDVIESLIEEQKSIQQSLQELNENEDASLGEKLSLSKILQDKIDFLESSVRELNAKYADLTYRQGFDDKLDIQEILTDIVHKSYDRFKLLDKATDRDVVKPISDISKTIFTAIDKLNNIKNMENKAERTALERDKSAQETLLGLYQERYEVQITKIKEANAGDDEVIIEGLDEL